MRDESESFTDEEIDTIQREILVKLRATNRTELQMGFIDELINSITEHGVGPRADSEIERELSHIISAKYHPQRLHLLAAEALSLFYVGVDYALHRIGRLKQHLLNREIMPAVRQVLLHDSFQLIFENKDVDDSVRDRAIEEITDAAYQIALNKNEDFGLREKAAELLQFEGARELSAEWNKLTALRNKLAVALAPENPAMDEGQVVETLHSLLDHAIPPSESVDIASAVGDLIVDRYHRSERILRAAVENLENIGTQAPTVAGRQQAAAELGRIISALDVGTLGRAALIKATHNLLPRAPSPELITSVLGALDYPEELHLKALKVVPELESAWLTPDFITSMKQAIQAILRFNHPSARLKAEAELVLAVLPRLY